MSFLSLNALGKDLGIVLLPDLKCKKMAERLTKTIKNKLPQNHLLDFNIGNLFMKIKPDKILKIENIEDMTSSFSESEVDDPITKTEDLKDDEEQQLIESEDKVIE